MTSRRLARLGIAATAFIVVGLARPDLSYSQMATAERVQQSRWWPTSPKPARDDYVGASECASCHRANVASQQTTSMAQTASRSDRSAVLQAHDRLTFRGAGFSYTMTRTGGNTLLTVSDGAQLLSAPLAWAFGRGNVGQSYLFERDGRFHESRVSYYDSIKGLDYTPNRALTGAPTTIHEAMGRPIDDAEARRCFGCHTTASTTAAGFAVSRAIPGVTCEACHGPGRAHVNAMERGADRTRAAGTILNPRRLDASDSVDLCGACHATFWDVQLAGERGIAALRSQPFRLQSSRCWSGDRRLACVACHDPHSPLVRDAGFYDSRCLACHQPGSAAATGQPPRSCPVATSQCVTCHMPKYDVPEMHYAFTDHLIRIPAAAR
jgi:Cytochrome c554 and c-prime